MKAEKVLGIVACAVACAMSTNAFAGDEDWFSAAVDNGDLELSAVTTNGVPVEIDAVNGKILLDNEFDSRLVFRPVTENPPKSDNFVKITSTALLTPSDVADLNSAVTELAEAKAGFAVGVDGSNTNFYGFANGVWTKLTSTAVGPVDGQDTTFTIAIDYRVPSVMFYVGDNVLYSNDTETTEFAIAAASNLASVDCFGNGSLTSLNTSYEIAVAAVVDGSTTNRYGSIAEAIAVAGDAQNKIAVVDPDTGVTDAPAAPAANGLAKWECEALNIAEDAAIALQPATKEVASDKIAVAVAGYAPVDGVSVRFNVKQGESVVGENYPADAIGIPLTTGTYTIEPVITAAP